MNNTPFSQQTRRRFLVNSAALGTVVGFGGLSVLKSQSAFAASRATAVKPGGCAVKHAEISKNLVHMSQGPDVSSSAMNHAFKTSQCSDCGTMISTDMAQAA